MSKKFLSGINVTGTATLNTVANAGLDTDKFLVLDAAGNVDFRTGDELKADIGADVVSRIEHEVKLGETMTIGTPVYVGVDLNAGTNMTVYKATNATEAGSSKTLGLIASSGITNDLVEVVTEGLLAGLNTSAATKGDPVWLGVNGALIFGLANKPVAPAHMVFLGIVTRVQSNNGEIFVKVQNGFEMNELHNYQEGSVQNNQVIVYESATSLYKPKSIPTILGYTPVPDSRTITINGTTYDLSANRAWTITTDASARSILRYVATANQTTFTISGGYTPGLTDVYRNGVKLDNSTDFTATNGTTIVLTNGASVNDVIEVYRYQTAFLANNALRVVTEFVATAGQTTFNVTYNSGLVDVFYNGSKLLSTEYTAGNGTSIVLNFACNVNDTLEVHAYSYQVGAFSGQAQLNGTGFVKVSGTTVTYDNSTYLTTSAAASTYLTTASAASTYLTTSSAGATYLPFSGGTLTGGLKIGTVSNPAGYLFELYGANQRAVVQDNLNGTAGAYFRVFNGSTMTGNATVRVDNTGKFSVFTGTSSEAERFTIGASGSIGVNTNSPITTFTVKSTNDNGYGLTRPSNETVFHWRLSTTETGSDAYTVRYNTFNNDMLFTTYAGGGTGGNITFKTGSSSGNEASRFLINTSGQVRVLGVGNTLAFDTLDSGASTVMGTIESYGFRISNNRGNSTYLTLGPYDISFQTSGTTKVNISSSGIMTRPYQTAFSVRNSYAQTFNSSEPKLVLDSEYFDIGGVWDSVNSRFTAPVSGYYLFTFEGSFTSNGAHQYHAMYLNKNGVGTSYRYRGPGDAGNGVWFGISGSNILYLVAGDYIEIKGYTDASSITANVNETNFCGYLLG